MAYNLIGKNFTPPDVRAKVTGQAKYAEDYKIDGMVFCRLLTSPVPHARITNINTARALALPGVIDVLLPDDVPRFKAPELQILTDEPMFIGDPILAVAAIDEQTAQDAIELITYDIEELPFTVDPLVSLYPGGPSARTDGNVYSYMSDNLTSLNWTARDFASVGEDELPQGEPLDQWNYGDIEQGFSDSALVLDDNFFTAGQSHHSMETRTAMANWQNGKCYLYGSTQSQTAVMEDLPKYITPVGEDEVPLENIVYIAEFCGGGFGSKARAYPVMALPAHFSRKIQRPVMLRISRAEEYFLGSARPGFQGRIKMGFAADGRMTAVDLYVVHENGPYSGFDDFDAAASAVTLLYQPPAMRMRAVSVQTNTPPRGAMRGPGENQMAVAIEPLLEKAANILNVDSIHIRKVNAADINGKYYANQGPVTSAYQREAIDKALELSDWDNMVARSGSRNGSKVRGVGIGQAFHPAGRNGYDGLIRLTPDGKLHIHSGAGNLGTYSHTGTSRVVAEVLKMNWENCIIQRGDSRKQLPWSPTQSGSNTSFTMTRQSYAAAMDALDKLKTIAYMVLGGESKDYDIADERVFNVNDPSLSLSYSECAQEAIRLAGIFDGSETPDNLHEITKLSVSGLIGTGLIGVAKDMIPREGVVAGIAVGVCEIELDTETGKYEILSYTGISDCGTVLHPQSLHTQIKGGAVQGFGMVSSEKHIYDPQNGLPGNIGFLQCKPPTYLDVPRVFIAGAVDLPDPQNPVGAKGMGEPPLGCAAAALACAISNALGGVYFNRVPVTPDMIVNHLSGQGQSFRPLQVNTA
jgi:xanthine dehydrogenase molybdenum-binding subunit